jgi:hypothetical protein
MVYADSQVTRIWLAASLPRGQEVRAEAHSLSSMMVSIAFGSGQHYAANAILVEASLSVLGPGITHPSPCRATSSATANLPRNGMVDSE